mgnify:CR=1 FL=1
MGVRIQADASERSVAAAVRAALRNRDALTPSALVMAMVLSSPLASAQSEDHFARQRAACILGRGSDPEDIVAAMRFILANKAFTGQMVAIDGGQHLSWARPDAAGTAE